LFNLARQNPLQPGDFVFYRPLESDVIVQFDEIWVVRGGKIIDSWHPIAHRL
jgi:D-serine deaminase-like pyridoxal phosphate-dependent protein